ncbi:ferredoxin [Phyllobacterium phragmitis]|nr:ferredoxin [Phyllobacterium phragmitis]
MHGLRVHIHKDMCCGFGNCATVCPAVFQLDHETNRVKCVDCAPIDVHADAVARAADECPAQAISLLIADAAP